MFDQSMQLLPSIQPSCNMLLQYVTWAELIYIQMLTPNASFLGHLAGILAGMLHVTVLQRLPMLRSSTRPFSGQGHFAQDSYKILMQQ